MTVHIALLRGVNVGGNNRLPMKDWREMLSGLGFDDVQTYIQSGNAIFRAKNALQSEIAESISAEIHARLGFQPKTFVVSREALDLAITANPYHVDAPENLKHVHFFFLEASVSNVDEDAMRALLSDGEAFTVTDSVFYFYAPGGIGRSLLLTKLGRFINVDMTARNLRTVMALHDMARGL